MNQHWLCKLHKLFPMMQESFTPLWTVNGWLALAVFGDWGRKGGKKLGGGGNDS
jgi:hypothetical protein